MNPQKKIKYKVQLSHGRITTIISPRTYTHAVVGRLSDQGLERICGFCGNLALAERFLKSWQRLDKFVDGRIVAVTIEEAKEKKVKSDAQDL